MLTKILIILPFIVTGCIAVQVDHGNPAAFEGDIGLDPETRALVSGNLSPVQAFKGTTGRIWSGGKVPYLFDRSFDNTRRQLINQAVEQYNRKTCIRFVPRSNERDYIRMVNEEGCWSMIGRSGGVQKLKLGNWCLQLGTTLHELMHAIGFFHEQSREDRDDHVVIYWSNIQSGQSYNFQKYRSNYYDQRYDLNSIMHYRNTEFSSNGWYTIASKTNLYHNLGNTQFSQTDLDAINKMYNCKGTGNGGGPVPNPSCLDGHGRCAEWQRRGECTRSIWMLLNCKKSCRLC